MFGFFTFREAPTKNITKTRKQDDRLPAYFLKKPNVSVEKGILMKYYYLRRILEHICYNLVLRN